MRLELRNAREDDLPALGDIFRRASWSNEGDRPLLTEHPEFLELSPVAVQEGRTRVALVDGAIVGFTSVVDGNGFVELKTSSSTRTGCAVASAAR